MIDWNKYTPPIYDDAYAEAKNAGVQRQSVAGCSKADSGPCNPARKGCLQGGVGQCEHCKRHDI